MKFKNFALKAGAAAAGLTAPLAARAIAEVEQGLRNPRLIELFGRGGPRSVAGSQTLPELIANIIRILLTFAGAIAVLFIIIGGYQYLTSGGSEEQAEKGKKTLINALIGVVIVILSYVVVNVIVNLVSGGFWF